MAAALATLFLAVGLAIANAQHNGGNLAEVLTERGFSSLVDLVVKAGLADTVSTGTFTIFAPTNAAFAALNPTLVDDLMADPDLLKSVLLYHVVPGHVFSSDLSNDLVVETAQGSSLRVNIYNNHGQTVTVNGVGVVEADVGASNGVIHVLDQVLIPPSGGDVVDLLAGDSRFTTLVQAVQTAGLVDTLKSAGPFTVFAPTNEAFDKLPAGVVAGLLEDVEALKTVLLRHVVPGTFYSPGLCWQNLATANGKKLGSGYDRSGQVVVRTEEGSATVIQPDLSAANGVVHVIDSVI